MAFIDKEKLIKSLELSIKSWSADFNSNAPVIARTYRDVLSRVENIPVADVAEIKHGKWVKDRATIKCSCCGFGMYQDGYFFMDGECFSTNNDKYTPNYCPNCGAKMDGKGGE